MSRDRMNRDRMKFYRQVRDYPYCVFATDFIYCALKKCGIDWTPYEIEQVLGITENIQSRSAAHSPHKQSPCSTAVQTAVAKILDRCTRDYAKVYNQLVADSTDKLGTFREHTRKVLAKLVTVKGTPCETMFRLLYVGKLTAVFYEHGTTSAADLAPIIIATALKEKNGEDPPAQWFEIMDAFSKEVVFWYDIDYDFIMDINISEVDSDEESSNDSDKADVEEGDSGASDKFSDKQEKTVDEEEEEDLGASDKVSDNQEKTVDEEEEEDLGASDKVSDKQEKTVDEEEEEDLGASDNVSDKQEKNADEGEEEDCEASDKVSDIPGENADEEEGEECGSSCEISDKQEDSGRERKENPDSSSEGTGENSSKKDCERGEKLSGSSELEDSCVKTDESSSDKKCSTVSDGCERAYDESCCSNNEPEPED